MATVTDTAEQAIKHAWAAYAEALRGLEGSEYEQAEQDAWADLQTTLGALGGTSLLPGEPSV